MYRIFFFIFFIPFCTFCRRKGGGQKYGRIQFSLTVFDQFKLSCLLFLRWSLELAARLSESSEDGRSSRLLEELCYKEYKFNILEINLKRIKTGDAIVNLLPVRPFCHAKRWIRGKTVLEGRIGIDTTGKFISCFSLLQEETKKNPFPSGIYGGDKGYSLTTARTRSNVVH